MNKKWWSRRREYPKFKNDVLLYPKPDTLFAWVNYDKLIIRLLSGASDTNIAFDDLRQLLVRFGFNERIRGDHHIFTKDGVDEILNLQPRESKAKPYQVKQVRAVIVRYKLGVSDVE